METTFTGTEHTLLGGDANAVIDGEQFSDSEIMVTPFTSGTRSVVLWDIDGTLSDDRPRAEQHLAAHNQFSLTTRSLTIRTAPEPDWSAYYSGMTYDDPIWPAVKLYQHMHCPLGDNEELHVGHSPAIPVFVTGRPERYRQETRSWLRKYVDPFADTEDAQLFMRETGSNLSNAQEKARILDIVRATIGEPYMAFEDNTDTTAFYRGEGIFTLQVANAIGH